MRILASASLALLLAAAAAAEPAPLPPQPAGVPWPTRAWPTGTPADGTAVERALDALFEPVGRGGLPDTRAVVAVQGGRLVAERYAEGFGPASRFRSWSMAKSVTGTLVGILVGQGRLSLDARAPVPEWHHDGDPRAVLTLRELLNMTSGLDNADGGGSADTFVAQLLFGENSGDPATAAERTQLVFAPGTHWAYSTGTSHILAAIVGRTVGGGADGSRAFVQHALAEPLGAHSLLFEVDATGHLMGGSYAWASARDWARLGYLYLRDGRWDGHRILPEGWVDFVRTPAPAENNGTYGAQFWINAKPAEGQFQPLAPDIDAFLMSGNAGQYVVVVPGRDLVVVRLGEMQSFDWKTLGGRVSALIRAFPPEGAAP